MSEVRLIQAEQLLAEIWPDESARPSIRWLRGQQEKRQIPHVRLGRLVYFNPDEVRKWIAAKTVMPRSH